MFNILRDNEEIIDYINQGHQWTSSEPSSWYFLGVSLHTGGKKHISTFNSILATSKIQFIFSIPDRHNKKKHKNRQFTHKNIITK